MHSLSVFSVAVLALGGQASASVARPRHSFTEHGFMHATAKRDTLIPLPYARADTGSKSGIVNLIPIRPNAHAKKHRRDTSGPFDLIPQDALYWAGEDGTVAELLIDMPGDDEAIVDMEYFDDLIESVTCLEDGSQVAIDFQDQINLEAAGEIWTWVNDHEDHHFFLMVGAGDCQWNEDRFLFQVDSMDITPDTKIATLNGAKTTWQEALHSYDLSIGKPAMGESVSEETLSKRGFLDAIGDFFGGEFNPDLSVPLDTDLTGKSITFNLQDGVLLTGKCNECSTSGSIDVEAKFRMKWFKLEEAFVELRTGGLSATAVIALTMNGDLTDALLQQSLPLFKASPAGVAIPGIVTIGPTVGIALTAGISAIKGGVTLTMGGTASVPESKWKLDFLSEEGSVAEGWEPTLEAKPLEAQAFIEVKASASLDASVGLELSVLETGFAAELNSKLPVLTAGLKALSSSSCTACSKFQNAIEGTITLDATVAAVVKQKFGGSFRDLFSFPLFTTGLPPLASFCEAIGPQPDQCTPNATWVGFRH